MSDPEESEFSYFVSGCYSPPRVASETTPFTGACFQNFVSEDGNSAMYVVDDDGTVFYLSDLEHRIQVPQHENTENDEDDGENQCEAANAKETKIEENALIASKLGNINGVVKTSPCASEESGCVEKCKLKVIDKEEDDSSIREQEKTNSN